jgi:hypothetical protein
MSKNLPDDNMYSILGKLAALTPPESLAPAPKTRVYESVEAQGSLLTGIAATEARLQKKLVESEKWIQKTGVSKPGHKGGLHRALHVPQGEKIPKSKIEKASHSKSPHLRHMAQFAKNVAEQNMGPGTGGMEEGAKVDRMVGHIKSSEKEAGHSDKKAENIAWATANKRGMLDNKNKKSEGVAEGSEEEFNYPPGQLEKVVARLNKIGGFARRHPNPDTQMEIAREVAKYMRRGMEFNRAAPLGISDWKETDDYSNNVVAHLDKLGILKKQGVAEEACQECGMCESECECSMMEALPEPRLVKGKGPYGSDYRHDDEKDLDLDDFDDEDRKTKKRGRPNGSGGTKTGARSNGDSKLASGQPGRRSAVRESLGAELNRIGSRLLEGINFAEMMKETHQTADELLAELQDHIKTFKETGHCSDKLQDFLNVHKHAKRIADEAIETPAEKAQRIIMMTPAVQRPGNPLSLGDVAGRRSHPDYYEKTAHQHNLGIHDELDKLAKLAGIPVEEADMEEGAGVMHYKAKKAKEAGKDTFTMGDKEFPVQEARGDVCPECESDPCECDDKLDEVAAIAKLAGLAEAQGELCKKCHEDPCECEPEVDEGNEFTGELAKAKAAHKKKFEVDGKTYPVKESLMSMMMPDAEADNLSLNSSYNSADDRRSVTVTAQGDKAKELMQLLKLSGLVPFGHEESEAEHEMSAEPEHHEVEIIAAEPESHQEVGELSEGSLADLPEKTSPSNPYDATEEDFKLVFEPGKRSGLHYALMRDFISDPYFFKIGNTVYKISDQDDGIPKPLGPSDMTSHREKKPWNPAELDEEWANEPDVKYQSMKGSTMGPGEGDFGEKDMYRGAGDNPMTPQPDRPARPVRNVTTLEAKLAREYESIKKRP